MPGRSRCPGGPSPPRDSTSHGTKKRPQMSLTGLLDVVARDAALAEAIEAATATGAAAGGRRHLDLVGPPAARPFAIA
ncbi:hypothetical protein, partial [Kitasatospora sp. MY 5-36]|uniref:hypothetical protein n=1 Tax=Kitasatospora sp. MY 5-36 TaxID=1678027 RepID=UPI00350EC45B